MRVYAPRHQASASGLLVCGQSIALIGSLVAGGRASLFSMGSSSALGLPHNCGVTSKSVTISS